MEKRVLGKEKLEVSEIGFGCMGLNYHRGPAKDKNEMISRTLSDRSRRDTF